MAVDQPNTATEEITRNTSSSIGLGAKMTSEEISPITASDLRPGDVLNFDNGGRIRVAWVEDGWVGFATWLPNGDEPLLRRMTDEDFAASIAMTPAKIVEYAHAD